MANQAQSGISQPSATVLDEAPGRTLTFLRGLTKSPILFAQLAQGGYTQADHDEGWQLLFTAAGYQKTAPVAAPSSPAFVAMTELDAWDEGGFARARAALERLHPEQAEFVFAGGLTASQGPAAVVGVKTFLDRLDALEHGKGRPKSERKGDLAAIATLEARGITKAERKRLAALVDQAQTVGSGAGAAPPASSEPIQTGELVALYRWYKDWSTTARTLIKKRASLIALGLANRKSPKKNQAAPPQPPVATPAPIGTTPAAPAAPPAPATPPAV